MHMILRPGEGRRQEDRKRHSHFTDLGNLRDHSAACFISQMKKSKPSGGKSLARGPGNSGSERLTNVPRVTEQEEIPRLVLLLHPGSNSHMAPVSTGWCLAGLRGKGWWVGCLPGQAPGLWTPQRLLSRRAIPPASCPHSQVHFSGHDPYLWIFPGVQSEERGGSPGGCGQRGEFLKGVWSIFWKYKKLEI